MERNTLERMTVKALRALARELNIKGGSRLTKPQLVAAVVAHQPTPEPVPAAPLAAPVAPTSATASSSSSAARGPVADLTQLGDLPERYHKTEVALLVQKPGYLYSYWEAREADVARANTDLGVVSSQLVLRILETTSGDFFDIDIHSPVGDWFIAPIQDWQRVKVQLGVRTADGRFMCLAESIEADAPSGKPSDRVDPQWAIRDGDFESVYALSGGINQGPGSEQLQRVLREGWAPSSSGSPVAAR